MGRTLPPPVSTSLPPLPPPPKVGGLTSSGSRIVFVRREERPGARGTRVVHYDVTAVPPADK